MEADFVGYAEYEAQPDLIATSTLGASVARHEYIKLEETETETDDLLDDGKSTEILGSLSKLHVIFWILQKVIFGELTFVNTIHSKI